MKALIMKRGNTRGRYYQGRTLKEIIIKFMRSKPNLHFIRLDEYNNRYEIFTIDIKTKSKYDRWYFYVIPKDKIIK